MKTIVKKKHDKDCVAMRAVREGDWKTPWAYPKYVVANRLGNKTPKQRGYIGWLKVICNDAQCPAEIWVLNDEFLALLPKE